MSDAMRDAFDKEYKPCEITGVVFDDEVSAYMPLVSHYSLDLRKKVEIINIHWVTWQEAWRASRLSYVSMEPDKDYTGGDAELLKARITSSLVPIVSETLGSVFVQKNGFLSCLSQRIEAGKNAGGRWVQIIEKPIYAVSVDDIKWLIDTAQAYGEQMCKSHDLREVERIRAAIAAPQNEA